MHSAYLRRVATPTVTRGVGVHEAAQSLLPEWAALVLGLLTQLGDVWFLFSALAVLYLLLPAVRERLATVIGLGLLASVLIEAGKHLLDLSRPERHLADPGAVPGVLRPVLDATATAGGAGFPSGHATLSTVVLLGLALALPWASPRRRAGVAIGLVVVISLSRIGLGVHFLVDVVAGVLLGLAVLTGGALAVRTSPLDAPTTTAGLAAAIGVLGVAIAAPSLDPGGLAGAPSSALLAAAGAVGALGGWQVVLVRSRDTENVPVEQSRGASEDTRPPPTAVRRLGVTVGGVLVLAGTAIGGAAAGSGVATEAGVVGLLVTTGVALPAIVPAFDDRVDAALPTRIAVALGRGRNGDGRAGTASGDSGDPGRGPSPRRR